MNEQRGASSAELVAIRRPQPTYDVAVMGGGLAGLTLAIQLKQRRPQISVAVLEKREGPAPEAAFKVGESTVTIGAHYFSEVVGMRDHLEEKQLKKAGLRFFLPANGNQDITQRVEHGPPDFPPFDTFQIDRGRFENELAVRARAAGADILHGSRVSEIDLADEQHTVRFTQFGQESSVNARWVVDAAGRASLMKRKLGLSREIGHDVNAAWFRLAEGLDFEQWGANDEEWLARMARPGIRTASTNHFMGEGYWVWLIPLSSGPISIGVCADPRYHRFDRISEFDRLLEWFAEYEPQLGEAVRGRLNDVEDFLRIERFPYGVERVLSGDDRWCLVGEAGAFADPFYSPGSDFIGLSNTFATDVICRELDGEDIAPRIDYFNDFYQRMFRHTIAKYEDLYPVFGNPWVCNVKLGWDMVMLQVPPQPFLNGLQDDLEYMKSIDPVMEQIFQLNIRMQDLFRQWHEIEQRPCARAFGVGGPIKPLGLVLATLSRRFEPGPLSDLLRADLRMLEAMAVQIFHKAASALDERPDPERPVNAYAVGLDPQRWKADGLYADSGLTLDAAREISPGVENLWLDRALVNA